MTLVICVSNCHQVMRCSSLRLCLRYRHVTGIYRNEQMAINKNIHIRIHVSEIIYIKKQKKSQMLCLPNPSNILSHFLIFCILGLHGFLQSTTVSGIRECQVLLGKPLKKKQQPWRKSCQKIQGTHCLQKKSDIWAIGMQQVTWSKAHRFSPRKIFYYCQLNELGCFGICILHLVDSFKLFQLLCQESQFLWISLVPSTL